MKIFSILPVKSPMILYVHCDFSELSAGATSYLVKFPINGSPKILHANIAQYANSDGILIRRVGSPFALRCQLTLIVNHWHPEPVKVYIYVLMDDYDPKPSFIAPFKSHQKWEGREGPSFWFRLSTDEPKNKGHLWYKSHQYSWKPHKLNSKLIGPLTIRNTDKLKSQKLIFDHDPFSESRGIELSYEQAQSLWRQGKRCNRWLAVYNPRSSLLTRLFFTAV